MKSVAVFAASQAGLLPADEAGTFCLGEQRFGCALIDDDDPPFDRHDARFAGTVLLEKRAFSANFRDQAIMQYLLRPSANPSVRDTLLFSYVGSEFVAEVIDVGPDVTTLAVGDRVIGDNSYPVARGFAQPGVATNEASARYEVLPEDKLLRIPDALPDDVAAGFSLGAQTAYAMVRQANLTPHASILLTAARSNTSLFVAQALSDYTNVYGLTSAPEQAADSLRRVGIRHLLPIDYQHPNLLPDALHRDLASAFDIVFDPFIDVHLHPVSALLAQRATYLSCGLYHQHPAFRERLAFAPADTFAVLYRLIVNNVRLVGNCLGTTDDLTRALADWVAGRYTVQIDSVVTGGDVAAFFERTFTEADRFGKVIYRYE